jgi:hypothetical protein
MADMTQKLRHVPTEQWCWFTDEAVARSVPCNGGPDDSMYVAVMPEDWPDELKRIGIDFASADADGGNVFFLHEQS